MQRFMVARFPCLSNSQATQAHCRLGWQPPLPCPVNKGEEPCSFLIEAGGGDLFFGFGGCSCLLLRHRRLASPPLLIHSSQTTTATTTLHVSQASGSSDTAPTSFCPTSTPEVQTLEAESEIPVFQDASVAITRRHTAIPPARLYKRARHLRH